MTGETPPAAKGVTEALVEAMRDDAFIDDATMLGTTQQDMRMAHYAKVATSALAALSLEGEASKWLGELLAIIHRDGGHYQAQHGDEKAVADAHAILAGALSTPAAPELGAVKVKPLDETQRQGWRDDKGRFCIPLSDGLSQDRE